MTVRKSRKEGTCRPTRPRNQGPRVRLPRDGGGTVSLADFKGQILSSISTRAPTPRVARSNRRPSRRWPKAFAKAGTAVLGVSADP